MSNNKEVMDIFTRMTESKEDFVQMLEKVENHQETMKALTQCYEEGDWARL